MIKPRGFADILSEVHPVGRLSGDDGGAAPLDDIYEQFRKAEEPLEARLKALVAERRELRDRLAQLEARVATGITPPAVLVRKISSAS